MIDCLRRGLARDGAPRRLEETVRLCERIMEGRAFVPAEPRTGFWGFLSDVFRFSWASVALPQAGALLLAALICAGARDAACAPSCSPLFVLAAVPAVFRGQYCRTSELEAATRASGPQIILAKLILTGAASLLCMTAVLAMQARLPGGLPPVGRVILYWLVPYLACMTVMLALIRQRRSDGMALCAAAALASCLFWRGLSRLWPALYEASAVGLWVAGVLVFSGFFAKEILFIVKANKEGKMYGIVH